MLPLSKEQLMPHECVEGSTKSHTLVEDRPKESETALNGDIPAKEESLDVEARPPTGVSESQAPIRMVDGFPWSP
jgi:hypothetical protein